MKKIEDLEDLTYKQLINYAKGLEGEIKDLKHIISELEYRLEKAEIQFIIEDENYRDELGNMTGYITTKICPEFRYCEFTKFKSEVE